MNKNGTTWILLLLVASALAQNNNINQETLDSIFGKPSSTGTPNVEGLEYITVKPTDKTTSFQDKFGDECQCVPYYLCDSAHNAFFVNNASVTGFNMLDIRFGESHKCQESVEICCKVLLEEESTPPPPPDPSKLKGCGYRNPNGLDFKITGGAGNEAEFGEFPWVVALMAAADNLYAGVGVLIHPQVVMTGAHIAHKFPPETLKIRAGEWDTATTKERLKSQERLVQDIVIHKDFNSGSLRNDMALLRLAEPVQLAEHINVICLPNQDENFDTSKNCVSNGWGKDFFDKKGVYAVIMKKVELDMVPHDVCSEKLRHTRLGRHFMLHSSFVCAGGTEGKDTCKGDGGGPLACPIGNERYKLSGLVAWGIGCGSDGVPAVYVAVPKFRGWVDDQMKSWGYDTSGYTI